MKRHCWWFSVSLGFISPCQRLASCCLRASCDAHLSGLRASQESWRINVYTSNPQPMAQESVGKGPASSPLRWGDSEICSAQATFSSEVELQLPTVYLAHFSIPLVEFCGVTPQINY